MFPDRWHNSSPVSLSWQRQRRQQQQIFSSKVLTLLVQRRQQRLHDDNGSEGEGVPVAEVVPEEVLVDASVAGNLKVLELNNEMST